MIYSRGWDRIARLHVSLKDKTVFVRSENVKRFTIGKGAFGSAMNLEVDNLFSTYSYSVKPVEREEMTLVYKQSSLEWQVCAAYVYRRAKMGLFLGRWIFGGKE